MKKSLFLVTLLVISVLAVSIVSSAWYDIFTGRPTGGEITCTDSDGTQVNDKGKIADGDETFTSGGYIERGEKVYRDVCNAGKTQVKEYYCSDGRGKSSWIKCTEGQQCTTTTIEDKEVGYCMSPEPSCEDLGNGRFRNEFGRILRNHCERKVPVNYECSDDAGVVENRGNECDTNCYIDGETKQARCREPTRTCEDSDNGINAETAGGVKVKNIANNRNKLYIDKCQGNNKIIEYSCDDVTGKQIRSTLICSNTCLYEDKIIFGEALSIGKCTALENSCSDTDSEETNPEGVGGTVTVTSSTTGTKPFNDKCINSKKVREYKCSGNSQAYDDIACTDICTTDETTGLSYCKDRDDKCIDSDGGKNPEEKGTVTTEFAEIEDFCADEKVLAEFGCSRNTANGWTFAGNSKTTSRIHVRYTKCKIACIGGECVPDPAEQGSEITT